jgi:hypothetical protein
MPEWIPEAEVNEVLKRIPNFVDVVLGNGAHLSGSYAERRLTSYTHRVDLQRN